MQLKELRMGMRVVVQKNKVGTVRFLGRTKFASGDWVGVELDQSAGKHDGIVEGQRYFQCARPNTGVFVRAPDVELEPSASLSRPSSNPGSPMGKGSMAAAMEAAAAAAAQPAQAAFSSGYGTSELDDSGVSVTDDEDTDQPGPDMSAPGSSRGPRGHFRSSSDLARQELAAMLSQPNSAFLKNKSGIVRELTTRIARRPHTTELVKSGILFESQKRKRRTSNPNTATKIKPNTTQTSTPGGSAGWAQTGTSVLSSGQRRLWVFGENAHGELSTGDEVDCFVPTEIKLPIPRVAKAGASSGGGSVMGTPSRSNASSSSVEQQHALGTTSLGTSDFAQVALGLHHMVVLTWNNEVLTCGSWVANLLGTDDRANLHRLKRLPQFEAMRASHPDNPIISIGCGDRHTVALHQDGACESFGGSLYGKLGHVRSGAAGDEGPTNGPTLAADGCYSSIPGLYGQRVTQMDAGNWHTLCATTEGAVYSFGGGGKFYNQGQLGHGDHEDRMVPRRIERFGNGPAQKTFVVSICCGGYHSLALTRDRLVYAWGSSKFGQLGLGSDNNESVPQLVRGLLVRSSSSSSSSSTTLSGRTIGLAAGENHSLAVQADGSVYSWGFSLQGQCGHGVSANEKFPRKIAFFATRNIAIVQVDAGWRHSIALSATHSVYTFGHGDKGQLGLGDTRSHSLPQLVESLEGCDIKTVGAGGSHSLAFNDFFKAAQELVFLQKVRAFSEVKNQGTSARIGGETTTAEEEQGGGSAASREAARQRRLGYAASPNPQRKSPKGNSSPSRADFGLGSPNPLVPLELKSMLREVAPESEEEEEEDDQQQHGGKRISAAERRRRALRRGSGGSGGSGTGTGSDEDSSSSSAGQRRLQDALNDAAGKGANGSNSNSPSARNRQLAPADDSAATATAAAAATSSSSNASLSVELVSSAGVSCTHRFFTFQTATPEAEVRALVDAYVAGRHGADNQEQPLLLQQLLVTPGNTVNREDADAVNSARSTASEYDESGRLTSTHLQHTFTYAPYGPPRYTLLLVLQGASESEALWPAWAADFHHALRNTCRDIAPGMQSRRTEEERAFADPAQPCFRELRPIKHTR